MFPIIDTIKGNIYTSIDLSDYATKNETTTYIHI